MDFGGFLQALYHNWVGLMSGIASVIFTFWGLIKHKKETQRKIFFIMAIFSFLIASISVWSTEHKRANDLSEQLKIEKQYNSPKLVLTIGQIIASDIHETNSVMILINVSVSNLGSPSSALWWYLSIHSSDFSNDKILPTTIPDNMIVNLLDRKIKLKFHQNNRLEEKSQAAIQRGSSVAGWLRFNLNKIDVERLRGAVLMIHVEDIYGNKYSAKHFLNDEYKGISVIPGSGDDL